MFVLSPAGRIERCGPPDGGPGPRVMIAGCAGGSVAAVHAEMPDADAAEIVALVEAWPVWCDPSVTPSGLGAVVGVLERRAPARSVVPGVMFSLPRLGDPPGEIVRGDSEAGARLLAAIARDGVPPALREAGFLGVEDFWAPWSVALVDGEIAAMAFAARLGPAGAEVGVYSFPAFRGRGLAGAVTAAWSRLEGLGDRALFYSTQMSNTASRRVAAGLGLARIGASVWIV